MLKLVMVFKYSLAQLAHFTSHVASGHFQHMLACNGLICYVLEHLGNTILQLGRYAFLVLYIFHLKWYYILYVVNMLNDFGRQNI